MEKKNIVDFRYAPPSSWTNIGFKDDFYKTLVREDGALLYDFTVGSFNSWQFSRVYEFGIRAAHGPEWCTQVTESASFPCVVTTLAYSKATLTLKTFAHQEKGRRSDIVFWEIKPHHDVIAFLTGITINIFDREHTFAARSLAPAKEIFALDPKNKPSYEFTVTAGTSIVEDESIQVPGEIAFLSVPERLIMTHPSGFRPVSAFGTSPAVLRQDEVLRGAIIVPQNYTDTSGLDFSWAEKAYREARAGWERQPHIQLPIQIPDSDIMDMLEACARNILQAREIKDGLPVFQVGPTVYRGLWVVDGHFLLEAAHYLGYQEEAYLGVDTLLKRVQSDGSIMEMAFHTKETGISLLTLVRQCELMGDDQRLRELWPTIQNGVAYIEKLREEAYALPEDSPCYRILPISFGDGGLGGMRGEYTSVLWILAGLLGVAKAAERLEFNEDARRFQADYDALLADFKNAVKRDTKELPDGTPYLPMCMSGSGEHIWIPDYPGEVPEYLRLTPASATWALCHAIHPGEVFSPDDPLVQNLLHLYDLVDDQEGIPAFTGWIPYQALWNYNASFGAHVWLYTGRGDKALDYLYAFANHASPTRVWREEQSFADSEEGQMVGDMPHNWASAEFIRLVRHLVVFERSDSLELLSGVPADWCKPGDVIEFGSTPTRFGPVSVRLETKEDGAFTLDVELESGEYRKPKTIKAKLQAYAVQANGQPLSLDTGGWGSLPDVERIHIEGVWRR